MWTDKLTVIIQAKNVASIIKRALDSLPKNIKIVLVDDGSTDETVKITADYNTTIVSGDGLAFDEKRNLGLGSATSDWVFYLDADEVVTTRLVDQIKTIVLENKVGAYQILRQNYFLGRKMYIDTVHRLFHKSVISGWTGKIHESPIILGESKLIKAEIIHYTHTDITSMLAKTNQWSEYEALLRIEACHPPMAWWRLIRIGVTVFIKELIGKRLWRYGREGWFEASFQIIDKLIVYTKLWERQNISKL